MKLLRFDKNNVRGSIAFSFLKLCMLLFVLCLTMAGCTLLKSKKDISEAHQAAVIVGRVDAKCVIDGRPIIVAARQSSDGREIAHYTVLHDSGEYELMVGQGEYSVFAYLDKNSNLLYEAGEPAGQHDNPQIVKAQAGGVIHDIDIVIPEQGRNIEIPYGYEIAAVKPEKLYSRQAGAIVKLDDERFAEEYGAEGFWQPVSFFKKMGGNIYFLEEYDPEKTPILFIHGAGGTPKGWKYFVENIDRTRFQPWFYYYPTGSRIDSMSYLLFWKLINLHSRYKFNKMYITAHSMGGLVARSFIVNFGLKFPYVKLFVSLATPWGGDKMAEYGVQQSPVVVPIWVDMQPEGDFIQSLYRMKMPEYVRFYMFYGYKGSRNPFLSNNDGTMTLSSILDYRPQAEATMNYAFNEDHASIAFSEEVIKQYNAILDEYDEHTSAASQQSKGHLKVHFSYAYDLKGVTPRPMLILTPFDRKGADTVAYLNKEDSGRGLGPFPEGRYYASLIASASAGRPNKKFVPVTIKSNETSELDFVFTPDGVVGGCVKTSEQSEDTPGLPEYVYRSDQREISIESVSLQGNGVDRKLQPVRGAYIDDNDHLIRRADFCYNECFCFYGLPGGEYTLTIKTDGYKTIEKKFPVVPGIPNYFQSVELTSE